MLKKALSAVGALALAMALGTTSALGASGEGGGDTGGEETVANNLSVPAVFVGTAGAPFTCSTTTAIAASGTTMTFPNDFTLPLTTQEDGTATPTGEYYIQGQSTWQAACANAADNTVSANPDWGDNLSGDASLVAGHPVRVEMGLLIDTTANPDYAGMMGYQVLKLTDELDRDATYGTMGVLADLGEVRAYDDGATWTITGPEPVATFTAAAELNATGRVVYGYNWNPTVAGDYTLTFKTSSVTLLKGTDSHTVSIDVKVTTDTGGGGGGEGTVPPEPAVTTQPVSLTVTEGEPATFTSAASGDPTPTVQWQRSTDNGLTWASISGATSTTYTIAATTMTDNGSKYRAVFTNDLGFATSNVATLTVNPSTQTAPAVTTQPTSQDVMEGQTASFTAAASGYPTPTVQWQVSTDGGETFTDIDGATSATYTTAATTLADSGSLFQAVFTNDLGTATSDPATLTVSEAVPTAPAMTTQPASQSVTEGQTASFTAAASGYPTPTVQWQVSTDGGETFTDISGATSTTYTTAATALADSGKQFHAVFTNDSGSVTSDVATLTVSAGSSGGGGGGVITPPAPTNTYPGGGYTSVPPTRILDTRASSALGPGATYNLTVAGQGGVPAGATGVVLNVTVVDPTAASFLTVFPTGATMPTASSLNFTPGQVVANQVTVPLGTGGAISIYNSAGSTHVVVDVAGYYSATAGEGYYALTPTRIEDTRTDGKRLGPGGSITIPMPDSVPAGATGVVLNVTATDTTSPGYLTVYPNDGSRPLASNLNFSFAGETVANRVHVKIANRAITIYNFAGNAQVVVDLNGYFAAGGATFTGVVPTRLEDTRTDGHTAPTNGMMSLDVSGSGNLAGVPAGAKAVVLNVTAVNPTMAGYLTVSPGSDGHPLASDLNFLPGQTVPNQVVVGLGNGAINFYNFAGSTDIVVDIVGWYI